MNRVGPQDDERKIRALDCLRFVIVGEPARREISWFRPDQQGLTRSKSQFFETCHTARQGRTLSKSPRTPHDFPLPDSTSRYQSREHAKYPGDPNGAGWRVQNRPPV